ncbi:hypothetical protein SVAN01_09311 [Stagonosporopsis vannaccii]|nr:hypothetical protein SVAN01_09311 [Stagonosporopsis vannaccii]
MQQTQLHLPRRARRDASDRFCIETERPRVSAARPSAAGVRNVKFSKFYVNCSTPSGACHPSPPQGRSIRAARPATRTPEQRQSVFTMLCAATPKGVSSPDGVARMRPDRCSGKCGVEDCEVEVFERLQKPMKSLKFGVLRGSASRLAQGLSGCNLNGGPTAAAVNGHLDVPVGSLQPRELSPTRAAHCRARSISVTASWSVEWSPDSHHSITHLGKWQISWTSTKWKTSPQSHKACIATPTPTQVTNNGSSLSPTA